MSHPVPSRAPGSGRKPLRAPAAHRGNERRNDCEESGARAARSRRSAHRTSAGSVGGSVFGRGGGSACTHGPLRRRIDVVCIPSRTGGGGRASFGRRRTVGELRVPVGRFARRSCVNLSRTWEDGAVERSRLVAHSGDALRGAAPTGRTISNARACDLVRLTHGLTCRRTAASAVDERLNGCLHGNRIRLDDAGVGGERRPRACHIGHGPA